MKFTLSVLLAAVTAVAFVSTAAAMPSGDAPVRGPLAYPMDCAKAKDPVRCETLNKKIEACKGKIDDAWRECMHPAGSTAKFTPPKPRDCTKARNKERCEAHTSALQACQDQTTRIEHRKCMVGQLAAPAAKSN